MSIRDKVDAVGNLAVVTQLGTGISGDVPARQFLRGDNTWGGQDISLADANGFMWGMDGDVTFDGVSTIPGWTRSGTTYTADGTVNLAYNNITVDNCTINPAGMIIYCRNLTFVNNGIIDRSGGNASGTSAGSAPAAIASPRLGNGSAGRAGVANGTVGNNGTAVSSAVGLGGAGGGGGNRGGTPNVNPGSGGGITSPWVVSNGPREVLLHWPHNFEGTSAKGGASGGGGSSAVTGGSGTGAGTGGGGGVIVIICAGKISGTGSIRANGGQIGTRSSNGTAEAFGGAGGSGGGAVFVCCNYLDGANITIEAKGSAGGDAIYVASIAFSPVGGTGGNGGTVGVYCLLGGSATIDVTGGAAGIGANGGANGSAGTDGVALLQDSLAVRLDP